LGIVTVAHAAPLHEDLALANARDRDFAREVITMVDDDGASARFAQCSLPELETASDTA